METQQQYVLTQDTGPITRTIFGGSITTTDNTYFNELQLILANSSVASSVEIVGFSEMDIERDLGGAVKDVLDNDLTAICICLDRFLLSEFETEEQYGERFTRFSMTRSFEGTKVPRQMKADFKEQVEEILLQYPDIIERNIVLVDDGLFTGGTVNDLIRILVEFGLQKNISKVIGYIGNGTPALEGDLDVQIIEQIQNLYDWIDIRDFGIFGGKKLGAGRKNLASSSVPYIAPWSDGKPASLDQSPEFFRISAEMLMSQKNLIQEYERTLDEELTFRDLVKLGFSLPTNPEKSIPISINDSVGGYINRCIELIKKEEERSVVIMDMDGTLYNLDGDAGGYNNSSLESMVNKNALNFIVDIEGCSVEEAETIFKEAKTYQIGSSEFFSARYGISREKYFNRVWDINPLGIVETEQALIEEIIKLSGGEFGSKKVKLVLLTSAPRIWLESVLLSLNLEDAFEIQISGEEYGSKEEIFQLFAGRYKPENILSIGDQENSDIIPGRNCGLNTIQVSGVKDTVKILKNLYND